MSKGHSEWVNKRVSRQVKIAGLYDRLGEALEGLFDADVPMHQILRNISIDLAVWETRSRVKKKKEELECQK